MQPRRHAREREGAVLVEPRVGLRAERRIVRGRRGHSELRGIGRRRAVRLERDRALQRRARVQRHHQVRHIRAVHRQRLHGEERRVVIVARAGAQRVAARRHVRERERAVPSDARSVVLADLAAAAGAVVGEIDVAAPRGAAVRIGHVAGDARRPHQLQIEIHVEHFLTDADGNRTCLLDRRHAGIVGWGVVQLLLVVSSRGRRARSRRTATPSASAAWTKSAGPAGPESTRSAAARDRVDVVVARHQPPHTILTAIVGLPVAGRRQAAIALLILVAHDADTGADDRFAFLVEHATGDHPAARQPELDPL